MRPGQLIWAHASGKCGERAFEIEDLDTDNADVIATVHTTCDEDYDKVVPPKWRDLFVAAPDMLAACENAANVFAALATGDLKSNAITPNSPVLLELRKAIKKAKGES